MHIIHLIHGTFAQNADWTLKQSMLRKLLSSNLNHRVQFSVFNWSGKNSHKERIAAGHKFSEYIKQTNKRYPNAKQTVIAHSHGGNIAIYALRDKMAAQHIDRLVTMGTPFLECEQRPISRSIYLFKFIGPLSAFFLTMFACSMALVFLSDSLAESIVTRSLLGILLLLSGALTWFAAERSLKFFNSKIPKFLPTKQKELLEHYQLPVIPKHIDTLIGYSNADEANFWLKFLTIASNVTHFIMSILMSLFKVSVYLGVSVLIVSIYLDTHAINDSQDLMRVIGDDFFAYIVLLALVSCIFQFINLLLPAAVRSNGIAFGKESLLLNFLCNVNINSSPRVSNNDALTLIELKDRSYLSLAHSRFYSSQSFLEDVSQWLNGIDIKCSVTSKDRTKLIDRWLGRLKTLFIYLPIAATLSYNSPRYVLEWKKGQIPETWEKRYPDISEEILSVNPILDTLNSFDRKFLTQSMEYKHDTAYAHLKFELNANGSCRIMGHMKSHRGEISLYIDSTLGQKKNLLQHWHSDTRYSLIDLEAPNGSYKFSIYTDNDYSISADIKLVCWESPPKNPYDWLPQNRSY